MKLYIAWEAHFLHIRARRVNEEKWNAFKNELIRAKQLSGHTFDKKCTHEAALNIMFDDTEDLADLYISSES